MASFGFYPSDRMFGTVYESPEGILSYYPVSIESPNGKYYKLLDKATKGILSHHQTPTVVLNTRDIRLLLIGDPGCGKTSLILNYRIGKRADDEVAYSEQASLEKPQLVMADNASGKIFKLIIYEASGKDDIGNLFSDNETETDSDTDSIIADINDVINEIDVVMACYSTDSTDSLVNVRDLWIPQVRKTRPDIPIVLVATKSDFKKYLTPALLVMPEEERQVAKCIGGSVIGHIQVSAYAEDNVNLAFDIGISEVSKRLSASSDTQTTILNANPHNNLKIVKRAHSSPEAKSKTKMQQNVKDAVSFVNRTITRSFSTTQNIFN
ncbi:unnamed protein product [Ambrosiozyma monospora]|uniref:Unnamed protein product n=1 Tax=Ambrosiozyma monospora TaxID=43982 RepID=A0A9W7DF49_AMBMO|nr:unnamed protein product [Ambrosiozyma monospora]